jgi:hypothetical protein
VRVLVCTLADEFAAVFPPTDFRLVKDGVGPIVIVAEVTKTFGANFSKTKTRALVDAMKYLSDRAYGNKNVEYVITQENRFDRRRIHDA